MANEREDRENEPKIRVIDRRMLNDDERAGRGPAPSEVAAPTPATALTPTPFTAGPEPGPASGPPHLEMVGASQPPAAETYLDADDAGENAGDDGGTEEELSAEEAEVLRDQMEEEQFAAYAQQLGRPLTDAEKEQVRKMMDKQMESMTSLEVAPVLMQTIADLSRFATVHLGLTPNPYTRLIARNDAEARAAIDAFGGLYEVLKSRVEPRIAAELARVLNDLRVNYTRITGASFTPPSSGPRIIR